MPTGKLVLFLVDGKTLDIPLDREQISIGRRTGNDICLPYPAVSGKHAVVVTTATGSVLEDLASTNGTHVNRRRIARHYLHDGDKIEIGRQQLMYFSDVNAAVPMVPRRAREGRADDTPNPIVRVSSITTGSAPGAGDWLPPAEVPVNMNTTVRLPADMFLHDLMSDSAESDASSAGATGDSWAGGPAGGARAGPPVSSPSLNVLTGPNAGRRVTLGNEQTFIGRVGLQVAAVRRDPEGFRLLTSEGTEPPKVNGSMISGEGLLLKSGDVIEVAGAKIEFALPSPWPQPGSG